MSEQIKIPRRILGTLLNSAGAGVVPRQGLEYISIGREMEIKAILRDLDNIAVGMGAFRFIVGKYGSGKSFLMGLIRANAIEKGFVTADADLSPERRFQGTRGQGVSTFREAMKNLSCKSMPNENALPGILSNWLSGLQLQACREKDLLPDSEEVFRIVQKEIWRVAEKLRGNVNGFDFAKVLLSYFSATRSGDEKLLQDAMRWFRGEFNTKAELHETDLNVATFVNDQNWYEFLKLFAVFFREIGFKGFLVFFDECVNLYKIPNRISRENNYEKILSMFNDTMQGKAEGIGFFLGVTPQMVEDTRRGLFSYEALRSRLSAGQFTPEGARNLLSPLIFLSRLSDNELFALCKRLLLLHTSYYGYESKIKDENILAFLQVALSRMGANELITPREVTRDFLNILDLSFQNPNTDFSSLIGQKMQPAEQNDETASEEEDPFFDLSEIKL